MFVFKNAIYILLAFIAKATEKNEILVLCYHSVGSDKTLYSVNKEDFYKQMDYLRKKYNIVSLEEIMKLVEKKKDLLRSSVAITFDDGYLDVFLNAYPYFKKYDMPATIFVTTGYVEKKMLLGNKYLEILSWNEIKAMSKNKIEIGAHTITHPKLTQIDEAESRQEIIGSKMEIEKQIGKEARFFAFPSDAYNQHLINLVKQLGFKAAVGGVGVIQKSASSFVLNRVGVDSSINFIMFKARLTKATNYFRKFEQIIKKMFAKFRFMDKFMRLYHSSDGQYQK
jgi:peptidoglycan/xylan/chitin deacetylase (PgdA/CDA1 family)